jgi:hypothetical protein
MTPEENAEYLGRVKDLAATAAAPAASMMSKTMGAAVRRVLSRTAHAPGLYWEAPRGQPPAFVTGNLYAQTFNTPAYGEVLASATVGNTAIYAAIQEGGGETWGNPLMKWRNTGGYWERYRVYVPEHSYFTPALREVIGNGTLQGGAAAAFEARMSSLL